jgi:hypothetical protein
MSEPGASTDGGKVPEAPLVAIGAILLVAAIVGGAVEGAGVRCPTSSAPDGRSLPGWLAGSCW